MLNEARTALSKLRIVLSALSALMLSTLITGCGGGGGGTSPAALGSATQVSGVQNFVVNGEESLATRATGKGLIYGGAIQSRHLADPEFSRAVATECGILVPETELKWKAVHPAPDRYDFSGGDSILAFAQSHNMLFRGHTLVWHEALPDWFAKTVTPANAEQMLRDHIATVVGHYAGKIHSWDVVNEAINLIDNGPDGLRTSSPWYQLLGPAYIETAFRAAAEADPNAMLVYNEFGLDYDTPEADAKRAAVLKLLVNLRSNGVPVHALGIQAHLNGNETRFNVYKLQSFLRAVAALGLKIIITEMDVKDQYLPLDLTTRDQIVAVVYNQYLKVVLEEPAVVAVLTWGVSDRHTWISGTNPRPDGTPVRPLPLDQAMNRKLAWRAIANAMDTSSVR